MSTNESSAVIGNAAAQELQGAELLQQRLSDPHVAEGLSRLLDRLDSVSFAVDAVEGFVARGEVIADSVANTVNELKHADSHWSDLLKQTPQMVETGAQLAIASKSIDVAELKKSNILQRLSDPTTLSLLNSLLDRLPLIAFMAESMEGFVRRGETIIDNVTGVVHELKLGENKIDFEQVKAFADQLPKLQAISEQVLNSELAGDALPKAIDAGVSMLNSGVLDKQVIETLGHMARAAVQSYQQVHSQPIQPVGGLFGTMRASKDPDVQKTIGFAFAFAKAFSKHLK